VAKIRIELRRELNKKYRKIYVNKLMNKITKTRRFYHDRYVQNNKKNRKQYLQKVTIFKIKK
jgi:hypothetical protein